MGMHFLFITVFFVFLSGPCLVISLCLIRLHSIRPAACGMFIKYSASGPRYARFHFTNK